MSRTQYRLRKPASATANARVIYCASADDCRDKLATHGAAGYRAEARAMLTDTQPAECWSPVEFVEPMTDEQLAQAMREDSERESQS